MRIMIDLQGAQCGSRHRGIGRYSVALAKAIIRNRCNHEIFILLNELFPETIKEIKESFHDILPEHHFIVFSAHGPADELPSENAWRVRTAELLREHLINDLKPDFFLVSSLFEGACDNTVTSIGLLFSQVPTGVILYDLIPYLNPDKYIGWEPARNWYYKKIDSLKRAHLLLAISRSAQQEAIEHLGLDYQRTINISSAVDTFFKRANTTPEARSELLARYGVNRKFLMHSSAFDERKNFEGLIKAFGALPASLRQDFQLVLVCKIDETGRKNLNQIAADAGLKDGHLVLTGFVPDDDLIGLYSECHLFVFPSFHEGFGLPALEAMSCGAATIGSNTSSIPEVIGREDALFDPTSTESIARLIEKALTNQTFWQSLKDHAMIQSKKFSWDATARITIEAFEKRHIQQSAQDQTNNHGNLTDVIESIASIKSSTQASEDDLIKTAEAIDNNIHSACLLKAHADYSGPLKWRIEGPFDSTYSLALLNRETARALDQLGHFVVLHSTEGPGDFPANAEFLTLNPNLAEMHYRVSDYPHSVVDVASRNLYPPRVEDMKSPFNLLHHYAWEESGFPQDWVTNFNTHLNGITCLSNHVEKILIDNGVSVPMLTSGCGVDHWERIIPEKNYQIKVKKFRFLHVSSCFPRKGADLLLDAYGLAFTSNDDVTLIIKTFENPHNKIHQWLAERKAQNPRFPDVMIIEGDLSDSELKALFQQCHVLVAPSKAEGFGLPMAEAMLSGLPVITTAWGGQLDFCDEKNSWLVDYKFERAKTHFGIFSSAWAKVNVNDLAKALIQAHKSPSSILHEKANAGRNKLLKNFKWLDVVGRAVNAANTWKAANDKQPEVRIGWVTTWNTKCGIATYSEHLLLNMARENVTVLAPHLDPHTSIHTDDTNCIRCWNQGKEINNFHELAKNISEKSLNTIVIQFNYGFYDFSQLREFIEQQLNNGRIVIVMMHATYDPLGDTANWRLVELQSILSRCHRILVHSISDLNRLKAIDLIENVALFPHGVLNYSATDIIENEKKSPLIASYGFCLPHKGLIELVEAIGILREQRQFVRLKLVNAEYPDPVSAQLIHDLRNLIKKLEIDDRVEMYTDYLADEKSLGLLSEANLIVYPYQQTGESASGAVRYGLASNKPIAVTPLSIFDDIGEAAFRFTGTSSIDIAHGIVDFLHNLSINSEKAQYIKTVAKNWRDQHSYVTVSKRFFNICSALVRKYSPRIYLFQGSSPFLRTVVGCIQGKNLVTTGISGNLIHGSYIGLVTGQYRLVIRGTVNDKNLAGASMDVAIGQGSFILGKSLLNEPDENGNLVTLLITLDAPCTDLEVRVWVSEKSDLQISMIEIRPWNIEIEAGAQVKCMSAAQ
jgi:glycosyltransferase involved in cell wall biosynthesis